MTERYRVAVFARNEATHILVALDRLLSECPKPRDLLVHVLVNGCTDRTLDIVQAFARDHEEVIPVALPFGDKCNAWNTYVYELADDSPCHFFTDGDVTCSPGSLALMQRSLLDSGSAMAIAGLPLAGRNRHRYAQYIRDWRWLFGNLYAVKIGQLAKLRSHGVRLPLGLCGNDHFISKFMAARSLDPTELDWEQNIHHPEAGFLFRPLAFHRPADWRAYGRRQVTYALRQLQIPELDTLPLTGLPATVDEVNRRILARLEDRRLGPSEVVLAAVRRRLRRMYPTPDALWFDRLLPASNHGRATPSVAL